MWGKLCKVSKRDNKYLWTEYYKPHPFLKTHMGKLMVNIETNLNFQLLIIWKLSKIYAYRIKYAVSVWEKISALKLIQSKINLII